jgi:vanillate O-demethylase monooxygenase subunit
MCLRDVDWETLAHFVLAFSHEVTDRPRAAHLLDERVVVYRIFDGSMAAAKAASAGK